MKTKLFLVSGLSCMFLSTAANAAGALTQKSLEALQNYCVPDATASAPYGRDKLTCGSVFEGIFNKNNEKGNCGCYDNHLMYDKTLRRCRPICSAGYNAEQVSKCGAGTYRYKMERNSDYAIMCINCEEGSYGNGTDNGSCKLCPTGKYQDQKGQASCKTCPAGTYQNATGKTSCNSCLAGSYCPAGSVNPINCPAGQYQPDTGKASCNLCPVGTYQNATGKTSCNSCPAGTYQNATGKTGCNSCPAGSYCPAGSANPITCPAGTYSGAGASSCTSCPAGSYCPAGSVNPIECPAGAKCPSSRMSSPTYCTGSTFQPYSGKTTCSECSNKSESCTYSGTCSKSEPYECDCHPVGCKSYVCDIWGDNGTSCASGHCADYDSSKVCSTCHKDVSYSCTKSGSRTLYYRVNSGHTSCTKYDTGSCS